MRETDDNNNNVVDESGWIGREFISVDWKIQDRSFDRRLISVAEKKKKSLILAMIKATHIHHQRRRGIVRDVRLDSLIATSKTFFLPPTRRSSVVLGISVVSLFFGSCFSSERDKNIKKRERENSQSNKSFKADTRRVKFASSFAILSYCSESTNSTQLSSVHLQCFYSPLLLLFFIWIVHAVCDWNGKDLMFFHKNFQKTIRISITGSEQR